MSESGYFEAYVNSRVFRQTEADRAMVAQLNKVTQALLGGQVYWAGSHKKATDIDLSDLDLCLQTGQPVTTEQRRQLREEFMRAGIRPADTIQIKSHVIRFNAIRNAPQGALRKVDLAFANATFGSRPLPDAAPFKQFPGRQQAARALKLWTRSGGMPHISGWAVEALVEHLDRPAGRYGGLALFQRILEWLADEARATPQAVEGVLRGAAEPGWDAKWGAKIPGVLESLRNQARAMVRRKPTPAEWRSTEDAGRWLCGGK